MKTLVIADIRSNVVKDRIAGHIVSVARNYQEALGKDFNIKIAAGPTILNSFRQDDCIVLPYDVCSESAKDKLKIFANFIVLLRKAKGDIIVIQHASVVTSLLSIALFFWWTSKIYLIQYNTDAVNSIAKRLINNLAKWKITGTLCPSDRIGKAYGTTYCKIPDYLYAKEEIKIRSYEERNWDICFVGGIYANKGVLEAARFLSVTDKKVIIAGRICEKELEEPFKELTESCPNIEFRLGFISDEDYINIIQNSRFCILNYRGTYFDRSSGVVLDVLYNGTAVLGTRCEALKHIETENLGVLYDNLEEIDMDKILSPISYNGYINAIKKYLEKQNSNIKLLCEYMNSN